MDSLTEKLLELAALYGTRIVGALAILVFGRLATGIAIRLVSRLMRTARNARARPPCREQLRLGTTTTKYSLPRSL